MLVFLLKTIIHFVSSDVFILIKHVLASLATFNSSVAGVLK